MKDTRAGYVALYENGELFQRIEALREVMADCVICPRNCHVDRTAGRLGVCRTGPEPVVSAAIPHFGEEPPLVGRGGSGTVFLTNCNLRCVYCQNYDISHEGAGDIITTDELAAKMVRLQNLGCHNINFVTPTHQVFQILASLPRAVELGLEVPLVYNCGGYESVDTLRLLDGVFDIYMPDIKYGDDGMARKYSGADDYVEVAKAAVLEMHRQVGDLVVDRAGVAVRGLIIRHLVLPGGVSGTAEVMRFIAEEVSTGSYVNVMDQYRPCYRAEDFPDIARRITAEEFEEALEAARLAGLTRLAG